MATSLRHYSVSAPAIDRFLSVPRELRAQPFVKWAGGKKSLLKALDPLFPAHFETYHEPFLGGGAVFFFLRHVDRVKRGILSDLNSELIELYRVVRDDVERLIGKLQEYRYDRELYYEVRAIDPATLSLVERAARLIFLNRTCYNGLYRVNSKGRFNVPFGRYKNPKICNAQNLRNCHRALQGVEIQDWSFETVVELAKPGDFVYLDPPYQPISKSSSFTSYTSSDFTEKDQGRLREAFRILDRRGALVMLSNSDATLIRDLYKGYDIREVKTRRFINSNPRRRGRLTELVIRNYS